MATKRNCNRCGVTVDTPKISTVTAVVPAKALSTAPVGGDVQFEAIVTMPEDVDYCLPCLISGLTAALIGPLAAKLPAGALGALTGHLRSIDVIVVVPVVPVAAAEALPDAPAQA